MLKKHYELRWYGGSDTDLWLYIWYGDDYFQRVIIPFSSMEEAELKLSVMGLEKGERKDILYNGIVLEGCSRWEVTPCS